MNFTFRHPSGTFETVPGVGVTVGVQFSTGLGPITPAEYDVPSGYTPVQTTLASGSPASVLSSGTGYFLRFFNGLNQTLLVAKFRMDDAAALNTARTTILAALVAGNDNLTITPAGTAYSGS